MGSYTMTANTNGTPITVHKEGEEGVLLVDRLEGKILTPHDQRPDWAEGLTVALIQDRLFWYEKRFGKESTAFKAIADETVAIEFSDLSWLGVDAEQEPLMVDFSADYRSEVVAKVLGVNTDDATMTRPALAERELHRENPPRTQAERDALEQSLKEGFGGSDAVKEDRQTATR